MSTTSDLSLCCDKCYEPTLPMHMDERGWCPSCVENGSALKRESPDPVKAFRRFWNWIRG